MSNNILILLGLGACLFVPCRATYMTAWSVPLPSGRVSRVTPLSSDSTAAVTSIFRYEYDGAGNCIRRKKTSNMNHDPLDPFENIDTNEVFPGTPNAPSDPPLDSLEVTP